MTIVFLLPALNTFLERGHSVLTSVNSIAGVVLYSHWDTGVFCSEISLWFCCSSLLTQLFDYGYEDDSPICNYFDPVFVFICAVNYWVELKASKHFSQIHFVSLQESLIAWSWYKEQFYSQLKLGLEIDTGTRAVTSKWSPAVDLKGIKTGLLLEREPGYLFSMRFIFLLLFFFFWSQQDFALLTNYIFSLSRPWSKVHLIVYRIESNIADLKELPEWRKKKGWFNLNIIEEIWFGGTLGRVRQELGWRFSVSRGSGTQEFRDDIKNWGCRLFPRLRAKHASNKSVGGETLQKTPRTCTPAADGVRGWPAFRHQAMMV